MGESRTHPENASASSSEARKAPPLFNPARIELGPGALYPDQFDPLQHNEWENFWHQVEFHFQPINVDHIDYLRSLSINPHNGYNDPELRLAHPDDVDAFKRLDIQKNRDHDYKREIKRERTIDDGKRPSDRPLAVKIKSEASVIGPRTTSSTSSDNPKPDLYEPDSPIVRAALNSFPFTHRLVAALLDEDPGSTQVPIVPTKFSSRHSLHGDTFWNGAGFESDTRSFQSVFEARVKRELREAGLLDNNIDDEMQTAMRQEQWILRDQKSANLNRKSQLYSKIVFNELPNQATKRVRKHHDDETEMAYLESMIRKMKKNKKSRSKYQKMFQNMYGHYKDKEKTVDKSKKVTESNSHGRVASSDDKVRTSGKKKKKPVKKSSHDLPAKSFPPTGGASRSSLP